MASRPHLNSSMPQLSPFTEDEKKQLLKESYYHRKASEDASEQAYGTEKYWGFSKVKLSTRRNIQDINWRVTQRICKPNTDYFIEAKKQYHERDARLRAKCRSLLRKEDRHHKKRKVLYANVPDSVVFSRGPYAELLLSRFNKASRAVQSRMNEDLKRMYGARKVHGGDHEVWSPVVEGGWICEALAKPTHLVSPSIGKESMQYIFGEEVQVNSARNGLWLPINFEEKFDRFQIAIVPALLPGQWKVLVIDQDDIGDGNAYGSKTFRDVDGAKLVFQNDAQPLAKYFFFHYLCALLRHSQRMGERGLKTDDTAAIARMLELSRAWNGSGNYVRENVVLGFIEKLDHWVNSTEAEIIQSHSWGRVDLDDARRLVTCVESIDLDSGEEDDSEGDEDECLPGTCHGSVPW